MRPTCWITFNGVVLVIINFRAFLVFHGLYVRRFLRRHGSVLEGILLCLIDAGFALFKTTSFAGAQFTRLQTLFNTLFAD